MLSHLQVEDNHAHFSSEVKKTVKQNIYIDDCLKSLPSEEEAVVMVKTLSDPCLKEGCTLTKWISNSRIVLQTIEEEHTAKDWNELIWIEMSFQSREPLDYSGV